LAETYAIGLMFGGLYAQEEVLGVRGTDDVAHDFAFVIRPCHAPAIAGARSRNPRISRGIDYAIGMRALFFSSTASLS
jgi:hypothetical protein